jgi:hypothetical protein
MWYTLIVNTGGYEKGKLFVRGGRKAVRPALIFEKISAG